MKLDKYEKAAINWLFKAQDATPDGGISKFYLIGKGWCPKSYKEVSGYIIPTLLDLYKLTKENKYEKRALKIADWELKVQEKNGNWDCVFDTGQVIIGLARAYKKTKNKEYKEAIVRAANWLTKNQDKNGNWTKKIFASGIEDKIYRFLRILSHSYNTRTAWALLEAWKITKDENYKKAAIKNLDLVLSRQLKNGYYLGSTNITHFLVYTARGFLEAGLILNNKKYIESSKKFADGCLQLIKEDGFFPGEINMNFKTKTKSSYLSANAQISILFSKLFKITKNKKYQDASLNLLHYLKRKQNLKNENTGIKGGIPGSSPINGKYEPKKILSWATKFYLDAYTINRKILKNKKIIPLKLGEQIEWISKLLNNKKIEYFIESGTLLGIMREGKILDHDDDIDFSLWNKDINKLKTLFPEIKKKNYKITEESHHGLPHTYNLQPLEKGKLEIDLKVFRKHQNYGWSVERYAKNYGEIGLIYYLSKFSRAPFLLLNKFIRIKFLNSFINKVFFKFDTWVIPLKYIDKTKNLEGTKLRIPANWKNYLKFKYGNWKVPNKNWNYIKDDQTLKHKDPLSMGIPIKDYY